MNVGELRAAIQGVPDDAQLVAMVEGETGVTFSVVSVGFDPMIDTKESQPRLDIVLLEDDWDDDDCNWDDDEEELKEDWLAGEEIEGHSIKAQSRLPDALSGLGGSTPPALI